MGRIGRRLALVALEGRRGRSIFLGNGRGCLVLVLGRGIGPILILIGGAIPPISSRNRFTSVFIPIPKGGRLTIGGRARLPTRTRLAHRSRIRRPIPR